MCKKFRSDCRVLLHPELVEMNANKVVIRTISLRKVLFVKFANRRIVIFLFDLLT